MSQDNQAVKLNEKIRKNTIGIAIAKVLLILSSFILIRLTYDFINDKTIYGVWATIMSILTWINYFDIGLGNGLRNKLAESIAEGDLNKGKIYVSTAYLYLGIFVTFILVVFLVIQGFMNWSSIFNIDSISPGILQKSIIVLIVTYGITFELMLIRAVSFAMQNSVIPSLIALISNILKIILILVLSSLGKEGLYNLALIFGFVYLSVVFAINVFLYVGKYKPISPSFSAIELKEGYSLLSLGIKFFIIQIAALVIFTTDNLIITRVLGPSEVTPYQLVHKLFHVFVIAASIIMTPLWSAYTDAFTRKDNPWMKKTLLKLNKLMIPLIIAVFFTSLFCRSFIRLWIGDDLNISFYLITFMAVFTVICVWNNIYAYILNGMSKTKLQLITALIAGVVNIPISILFAVTFGMGNSGVILGSVVSLSIFAIVGPMQLFRVLKGLSA